MTYIVCGGTIFPDIRSVTNLKSGVFMEKLSVCEEQILLCVMQMKKASGLRDVINGVNERYGHDWKTQTVSTFLSRTVKKGYLKATGKGKSTLYYPVNTLEEYQKEKLQKLLEELFDDDTELLLRCLNELERASETT